MHMLRVLLLTVAINTSSTLGGRFRSRGVYEQPTLIGSINWYQFFVEEADGSRFGASQQGISRCETD